MELKKKSESVSRSYDADGEASERIDSINYDVIDANGNAIGNAYVTAGNASATVNIYDFTEIEEGESRLKEIFGINN